MSLQPGLAERLVAARQEDLRRAVPVRRGEGRRRGRPVGRLLAAGARLVRGVRRVDLAAGMEPPLSGW